jgi:hypothetical protein
MNWKQIGYMLIGLILMAGLVVGIEVSKTAITAKVTPEKAEQILQIPTKDYDQTAYDKGVNQIDRDALNKLQSNLMNEHIKCATSENIQQIETCIVALKTVNKRYETPIKSPVVEEPIGEIKP